MIRWDIISMTLLSAIIIEYDRRRPGHPNTQLDEI